MRDRERFSKASPQETADYVQAWKAKDARTGEVHMMLDGKGALPVFQVKETPGLKDLFTLQPIDQDVETYWDIVRASTRPPFEAPQHTWINATYEWAGYATISLLFNGEKDKLLLEALARRGHIGMVLSKEGLNNLEILVSEVSLPVLRGVLKALRRGS